MKREQHVRSTIARSDRKLKRPLALSDRDRHALYIGFLSICTLIVLSRGVPAWLAWKESAREDATIVAAEVSNADALLRARGSLSDSLASRGGRFVTLIPKFLTGSSPEAAGTVLASLVSDAASEAQVQVGSLEIHADSLGVDDISRVAVRATGFGDVGGVMAMLAGLEGAPQLLIVRSLTIDQAEPDAPTTTMERLQFTIVVEGLLLTARNEEGS
jgi:hypothetical protein